ncbi:MAG TPA: hypothetical protein VEV38_01710, partial [Candidatus Eremiobacteraceae bacterium]|nr:hypothetical protein [Candidatus Eremiobacteraceae bacterium]
GAGSIEISVGSEKLLRGRGCPMNQSPMNGLRRYIMLGFTVLTVVECATAAGIAYERETGVSAGDSAAVAEPNAVA